MDRDITAVYRVLTFGWRGAPGHYMTFAWVIKDGLRGTRPPRTPRQRLHSFLYHDPDGRFRSGGTRCGAETGPSRPKPSRPSPRPPWAEKAINEEKDWEEGRYESSKIVWGLLYDSDLLTRSLPEPKLLKAAHLLNLPDFSYGCRAVDLSLVQELRGNQQFWLSAMPILFGAARGYERATRASRQGRPGRPQGAYPGHSREEPGSGFGKPPKCRGT